MPHNRKKSDGHGCIMKGTGLETDGMMAWANQPLQTASMVMYSGAGSPIFKLSFKNRFSSLPLRQFSQMLYAVAAA